MNPITSTERAIRLIRKSRRIVALSGAGISTEAGIPDFRGAGGLWENDVLMQQLSLSGFKRDPEGFYRESVKLFSTMAQARPTLAHQLLARLEEAGKLTAVVTQNIDGLHQAAGSQKVYELHGTYCTGHCPKCCTKFPMADFYSRVEKGHLKVPLCPGCAKPIKPDVVLFEDLLPEEAWQSSVHAAAQSDLMLILGSSLVVYPAAELPMIAVSNGAALAIVNMEETGYDNLASVVVRGKLGEFAQQALTALV